MSLQIIWKSGAAAIALLAHQNAAAQDAAESRVGGIEEIVVTAQKRSQSVQDVGITMSVLTSDMLQKTGVRDVVEVTNNVPNVQVNYGLGQNAFNIRGIGINEFSANLDSPVAVHVDEVYLSKNFMSSLLLFDIDRVEALKGPQGTLFGRNTTGGAINFYTRRPTDTLSMGGSIGYDNYETVRGEAYISGPLTENLSARLAGMIADQGQGFYRNLTTGREEGKENKWALRGQLAWKGEQTSVYLSASYGRDRSNLPPYEGVGIVTPESFAAGAPVFCAKYLNGTVTGADADCVRGTDGLTPGDDKPYTSNGNLTHRTNNKGYGFTGRVEHDLSWADLTSISSYQYYRRDAQEDSDGSPVQTIENYWQNRMKQFSQEVRLSSKGNDRWNYILGAYYQHDDYRNDDYLTIAGGAGVGLYSPFTQKVDAVALFFHNDVELTDSLSLIAGVRYSREKVRIDGGTFAGTGLTTGLIQRPVTILGPLSVSSLVEGGGKRTDEDVSFKIGVEWKPRLDSATFDELMVYANMATGFRSGAFNADFADRQEVFTSLDPEKLTAYEAGFKSSLAGRTVQINGAIFRYDFRDGFINVDSTSSPVPVTINAANIKTLGAELDVRWLVLEGLEISGNAGWLDSEIKSNIAAGGRSLKGNSPVNAPKWTLSGALSYEMPITNELKLSFSASANYRGSQYLEAVNSPGSKEDRYWLVNGQVGIGDADGRWRLSAWVKNLTKTRYRSYVNDLPAFGWLLNLYGPPRTMGGTLTFKY